METASPPAPEPRTVRRTIKLHPVQAAFCRSDAPVRGFIGGRGAGKTHIGCLDLIRRARRGGLYLVAAPTYSMLQDATFRTFLAVGRDLGVIQPGAVRASVPPAVQLSTGAEVIFRSTDQPDRLRGPSYSGCLLDEGSQVGRDAYEIILAALRQGGERGWLSVTTTPRGFSHWTYEVFGRTPPGPDTETFHCPTRDNPFLPAGFEEALRPHYGNAGRARQELGGEFMASLDAEWDSAYFGDHVWFTDWPPPDQIARSVLAVDGSKGKLTGDPQALVLARLDFQGRFWVDCREVRLDEARLLAETLRAVEDWNPTYTVVEENGAGYYLLSQLSKSVVRGTRPAVVGRYHTANKDVRINTRLTSQWAQGTIRLRRGSPGCRLLLGQARDFPNGQHDDLLDALSMGLELHGELNLPPHLRGVRYTIPGREVPR